MEMTSGKDPLAPNIELQSMEDNTKTNEDSNKTKKSETAYVNEQFEEGENDQVEGGQDFTSRESGPGNTNCSTHPNFNIPIDNTSLEANSCSNKSQQSLHTSSITDTGNLGPDGKLTASSSLPPNTSEGGSSTISSHPTEEVICVKIVSDDVSCPAHSEKSLSSSTSAVQRIKIVESSSGKRRSERHLVFKAKKRPDIDKIIAQSATTEDNPDHEANTIPPTAAEAPEVAAAEAPGAHAQPETDSDSNGSEVIDVDSDVSSDYADDLWEDWEDERLQEASPHAFYIPYRRYLVKVLSMTSRQFLSDRLNGKVDGLSRIGVQKDWMGFAHCMGRDQNYIYKMERYKDPFGEMLLDWQTESGSTIGKLLHYLQMMDRYDIIDDTSFMDMINRSVKTYDLQREDNAKEHEEARQRKRAERRLRDQEEKSTYHAFICFDEEDGEFMKELIYELETKQKLNICINAKDLLSPGQVTISAEEIKARCKRMIVVLSETILLDGNEMYDFAMRIAQSLSPVTSRSKVIPIVTDTSPIPHCFAHITPLDFSRCLQRSWLWRKISATLKNPPDPIGAMERQKLRHIHLVPKEHDIDLRVQMREEDYSPPDNPIPRPRRLPSKKTSNTSSSCDSAGTSSSPIAHGMALGVSERSALRAAVSGDSVSGSDETGRGAAHALNSTREMLRRTWFNLFKKKGKSSGPELAQAAV